MKQFNKTKGNIGEQMAREYLEKKGYECVETNYRNQIGEIDIIVKDKNTYVFVEVKYKDSLLFGYPREMVTYQKQNKIRMTASVFLKQKKLYDQVGVRFDVVEVIGDRITHIENAF